MDCLTYKISTFVCGGFPFYAMSIYSFKVNREKILKLYGSLKTNKLIQFNEFTQFNQIDQLIYKTKNGVLIYVNP